MEQGPHPPDHIIAMRSGRCGRQKSIFKHLEFGGELARLGIPLRTATVTAQVTIVIAVTYLTIIFGELVPKRIGMNSAEKIAKLAARPMRLLSLLASPFVWLLSRSTAGVTRLLGLRKSDSKVTEEEIRSIIQEGAEDGEVQEVEQKIMGRVFSLGDRTVESIMTLEVLDITCCMVSM